jgi:WD40 repeat protein
VFIEGLRMYKRLLLLLFIVPSVGFSQEVLWNYHAGSGIWSVAISSDGSYAAVGSFANTTASGDNILYFDSTGRLLWSYKVGDTVWSVSVSGDGEYIAAGSKDNNVYFFRKDGSLLWSYKTGNAVWSVSVSADGGYVAVGSYDNSVYFFDRSGKLLWRYKTDDIVLSVSVSADGGYVAVGSYDNSVYFFDRSGKLLWRHSANNVVVDTAVSADGGYVAVGSYDNSVYFFDRSGKLLWKHRTGDEVWDVSISGDGGFIVAGSKDYNVYFFNSTGGLIGRYSADYYVSSVATSFDGNYTIAGSYDTNVYFFKKTSPRPQLPKIPELVVSRQINSSQLLEGEGARVTISITNIGDGEAFNVNLREAFPSGIELLGGESSWSGKIKAGESKTVSYDIRAIVEGNIKLPELEVTYEDSAGNIYTSKSGPLEIVVRKPSEEREAVPSSPIMLSKILPFVGLLAGVLFIAVIIKLTRREEDKGELLRKLKEEIGAGGVEEALTAPESYKPLYDKESKILKLIKEEIRK